MKHKLDVLTNSDSVDGPAKSVAKVELAGLDLLATLPHGDGNGDSVRNGEADNTNTGEGIERGSRAEVDDTEEDLNDHREHHGVEREVEAGVNLAPELGAGNGTVTGECPGAAGSGGGAASAAEDAKNHEGEEQADGTSRRAGSRLDDGGDRLAGRQANEHLEVGEDEHEGDEEEEAADSVDDNGQDHGLGDLSGRRLNLLAH
jgi:hypothetical protein